MFVDVFKGYVEIEYIIFSNLVRGFWCLFVCLFGKKVFILEFIFVEILFFNMYLFV